MADEAAPSRSTVLLGPQKEGLEVGAVLRELGVAGRVALVTAGWQEREADDAALVSDMAAAGLTAVNLKLHARSVEAFDDDEDLAKAHAARQERLRRVQGLYRIRLDHADAAARAISVRHVDRQLLDEEEAVSVGLFRWLDLDHVARCRAIHDAFTFDVRPHARRAVLRHVREIRATMDTVEAVVISGGHVASLLNRLLLFDLPSMMEGKHLVAWSAGAMVLTDRIVLFHDFPPYGSAVAQLLDAGLGLAPGIAVLPDPKRRIRLDDAAGIARFARRMAPARCLAMDHGARLELDGRRLVRVRADRLGADGSVESGWTGGA